MLDHTYIIKEGELVLCVIVRRFMTPFGGWYKRKYKRYYNTLDEAVAYVKTIEIK